MPSASGELRQRVVDIAQEERVPVKTLPGPERADLRRRRTSPASSVPCRSRTSSAASRSRSTCDEVAGYLARKTVLVTGAGGSIGAELCRQIARVGAGRIVLVDHSEPALFEIERELVGERGFSAALPVLADVGNRDEDAPGLREATGRTSSSTRPRTSTCRCSRRTRSRRCATTCSTTKTLADVAVEFETKRFVLVSTDKAAQPKNLLGQSKAIGEWIVQAYGSRERRRRRASSPFASATCSARPAA